MSYFGTFSINKQLFSLLLVWKVIRHKLDLLRTNSDLWKWSTNTLELCQSELCQSEDAHAMLALSSDSIKMNNNMSQCGKRKAWNSRNIPNCVPKKEYQVWHSSIVKLQIRDAGILFVYTYARLYVYTVAISKRTKRLTISVFVWLAIWA